MNATPATRSAAITAMCRDCCHDGQAAGTWRQQVSACSIVDCPLWKFRPLAQGVPDCITARDASQLPRGWRLLSHDEAVAIVAGRASDSPYGWSVERNGAISPGLSGTKCLPQFKAAKSGAREHRERVAV